MNQNQVTCTSEADHAHMDVFGRPVGQESKALNVAVRCHSLCMLK